MHQIKINKQFITKSQLHRKERYKNTDTFEKKEEINKYF